MGQGRKGTGVDARANSVRVRFTWRGERCCETLDLKPTPGSIKEAKRIVEEIRRRIALGSFEYAEFFPDSPRAGRRTQRSFGALADEWMAAQGHLAEATRHQYALGVAMWKALLGADTPLEALTYQALYAKIGAHPWASAKSLNNYLTPLRGIFKLHYAGEHASKNPMPSIMNRTAVRQKPDPLTTAERDRILADMRARYDLRVVAYFQFAFYTGMRPEEIIALRWTDIDWGDSSVRVQRVRTFRGGQRRGSKTHAERDVDLFEPALEALSWMKAYTFMKKNADGDAADIFENPTTGEPWNSEKAQRDSYWAPCLRRLGIRGRRAYATRHTYATAALMTGVPPAYIASQLGHANAQMLHEKYAKWINGADQGNARKRLEQAFKTRRFGVDETPEEI